MQRERTLSIPSGYDAVANPRIVSFAAQLDDQLHLLKRDVADLETRHLEWQPGPGINTVGMLLAHLAIVDVWWITVAPRGVTRGPESEALFQRILGIGMDDDGMPAPADAGHPAVLAGRSLADYLRLLDAARAATHAVLRTWRDVDLPSTYVLRDLPHSYEWTIYHVLEHFAAHYGQILLLRHLMRDVGVLRADQGKR